MVFKDTEKKTYVIVKNFFKNEADEKEKVNGRPKFFVGNQSYGMISGIVSGVSIEIKDIVPTKGDNAGKEITIHNLIVDMVSTDGEFELQLPLYSVLARAVMNMLAGGYKVGDEIFFSVYNNKKGFRTISIRNSEEKEDYVTPFYNREQELAMVEERKIKWVMKKDYDALSDKYVEELLPLIQKKFDEEIKPEEAGADDTIPF